MLKFIPQEPMVNCVIICLMQVGRFFKALIVSLVAYHPGYLLY